MATRNGFYFCWRAAVAVWHAALILLIVVAAVIDFVPLAPVYPNDTLDSAWAVALNEAVTKGLVFGRDVIFTFGPYASVYTTQYSPGTNNLMMWGSALLATSFAASLICLTRGFNRLMAVGFTIFLMVVTRDSKFLVLPLVYLVLCARMALPSSDDEYLPATWRQKLVLALATFSFSLLMIIKSTFCLAAITTLVLGLGMLWRRQKRLSLTAFIVFVLALVIFWCLAGQPLAALPWFFASQLPIISGYGPAMAIIGPVWQVQVYVAVALFIVLVSFCTKLLTNRVMILYSRPGTFRVVFDFRFSRFGLGLVLVLIGLVAVLFLSFKEAFIRQDGHFIIGAGLLGATGWVLMLGRKSCIPAIGLIAALGGWADITKVTNTSLQNYFQIIDQSFVMSKDALLTRFTDKRAIQNNYNESLQAIRDISPLPKLNGSTDIYTIDQAALIAWGLDWSPRPIIQSYSAYTPALAYLNASHLTGPNAPQNIVFALDTIDGQLPSLADGASWPELLTSYNVVKLQGSEAFLHRRDDASHLSPPTKTLIAAEAAELNQPVMIPQDITVVWAQIHIKLTLRGKITSLLFRVPPLQITYVYPGGGRQTFRYIAGMGAGGFLVKPVVADASDLVALKLSDPSSYFSGLAPTSFIVSAQHGTGTLWRSRFSVQLFSQKIPLQTGLGRVIAQDYASLSPASSPAPNPGGNATCSIDTINKRPLMSTPLAASTYLRVDGWAIVSLKQGIAPDRTLITITNADGALETAPATITERPDVNNYLNLPQMGPVGYTAALNLSSLPAGNYQLGVQVERAGQSWACPVTVPFKFAGAKDVAN